MAVSGKRKIASSTLDPDMLLHTLRDYLSGIQYTEADCPCEIAVVGTNALAESSRYSEAREAPRLY